jgi:CubicO group peptidase (beta-lactamase class C family)
MDNLTNGYVAPRFVEIKNIFDEIIRTTPESGAALSIWHEGKNVVDLWGGLASRKTKALWNQNNAAVIFSCTKGLMSLAIAKLYESGKIKYDDLVTKFWPEYGESGKANTTVKELVAHRAGLPFFESDTQPDEVLNWNVMVSKIQEEKPLWNPGDHYAYHALTHGWLTGELIRRVSGLMPGQFLAQEIASPLKADTWLGLNPDLEVRVAHSYPREDLKKFFEDLIVKNTPEGNFLIRSLTLGSGFPVNLVGEKVGFNSPKLHQAEIPGAGGISTATGLAKIWSSAVHVTDGIRTINDSTVEYVTQVQSEGKPFTDLEPPYSRFGMGFQLDSEARRYLTNASFGHDGAGGQCAFADPVHRIGFAFVTTEMGGGEVEDDRATRIIEELRKILDS